MTKLQAVDALVVALDAATGATPALRVLARPRYPMRELQPELLPDGSVILTVAKWGWQYKRRSPRPSKFPLPADETAIKQALNAVLPAGIILHSVSDMGEKVMMTISD